MPCILSLDLGTTALKLLVLSDAGVVRYNASVPYPTQYPQAGWIEQNPSDWEAALHAGLKELLAVIPSKEIDGICFSGNMSSVVIVDSEGKPVHPCITLADGRSEKQTMWVREHFADEILHSACNSVINAFSLPKILWVKEERPEAFSRAAFWMSAKDYLRFLVTGQIAQDYTDACNSLCVMMEGLQWNLNLIRDCGLPAPLFPTLLPPYERAGQVCPQMASASGLREGTPVFTGGGDMACAVVSIGMRRPGDASISLGTNSPFIMIVDHAEPAYVDALTYHLGAEAGTLFALGSHFNGGVVVNSFSKLFSPEGRIDYDLIQALSQKASQIPPGAEGLVTLPFLLGSGSPYFCAHDRGTVIGLNPATTQAHCFRSVLEGMTMNLRQTYDYFRTLTGGQALDVALFGGGTKIPLWPQLFADIFGEPMRLLSNPDASAIGAAMIGFYGAGHTRELTSLVPVIQSDIRTVEPIAENIPQYEKLFARYKKLYEAVRPIYDNNE